MTLKDKKVGVISLGCDKNRVDTEKMLFKLSTAFTLTANIEDAEIIVINTCAFLESARAEAIGETLSCNALRNGKLEKIVMTGCLPQKYIDEIFDDLVEVDAFLGVSDYDKIVTAITEIYQGKRVKYVGEQKNEKIDGRVRTTDGYAYLKIADGCSNHCTYCLIPSIRGKYRSVPICELVSEAQSLGEVSELILVAQDVTAYGKDIGTDLVTLLTELVKLDNVGAIRLLYCYPENITDNLIDFIASNQKIIRYLDIPFQHADDGILKLMNRKGTGEGYLNLIKKLRSRIDGVAIRSTFIAGFPTEDEQAFNNLLDFIAKAKLFNAGFFAYSKEYGTPAYKLPNQVLARTKTARVKKLYSAQKKVVKGLLGSFVGQTLEVTVDGFNGVCYEGRAYFSAPDIDGKVFLTGEVEMQVGKKYNAKITTVKDYDLFGTVTENNYET